ncbi:hypothetical protein Tco_1003883 [Tanacetum coccineum]|uniref:Uncharacterized protein n=1 Tax=Tanacetum coccineum TaxID=301880 RepID=A0ABQ5FAN6_9ASTR
MMERSLEFNAANLQRFHNLMEYLRHLIRFVKFVLDVARDAIVNQLMSSCILKAKRIRIKYIFAVIFTRDVPRGPIVGKLQNVRDLLMPCHTPRILIRTDFGKEGVHPRSRV